MLKKGVGAMRGRFCGGGSRPTGCWGVGFMVAGLLLLILALPGWLWMALIGLVLIAVGFFLLRFG